MIASGYCVLRTRGVGAAIALSGGRAVTLGCSFVVMRSGYMCVFRHL
jgi:hypothetical protein